MPYPYHSVFFSTSIILGKNIGQGPKDNCASSLGFEPTTLSDVILHTKLLDNELPL